MADPDTRSLRSLVRDDNNPPAIHDRDGCSPGEASTAALLTSQVLEADLSMLDWAAIVEIAIQRFVAVTGAAVSNADVSLRGTPRALQR
jgi:hypothetical protein